MAKDKIIFILKADSTILLTATNWKAVYDCIRSKVSYEYSNHLRSYVQYSRYLTRYDTIVIPIPYSPPFYIEKHILRRKFKNINVQAAKVCTFTPSPERISSAEVHLKG